MKRKFHCNFINEFDLFGKETDLYYKGKSKITSLNGSIFTIIYSTIYCAFFVYKFIRMLLKKDVTFYDTYAYVGEPPFIQLSKDKFFGGFALGNPLTLETYIDDSIYYVQAEYKTGKKEGSKWTWNTKSLETEPCKLEQFGEKYRDIFKDKQINNLHCVPVLDQLLQGHLQYDVYSYFSVKFYPCINSTKNNFNCKPLPIIKKYLTQTFVAFKMEDIDLTPQIYNSPIQLRGKEVSANVGSNLFKDVHSFFQVVNIETDEDIFGFDFYSKIKKEKYIKYDQSIIISSLKDYDIFETGDPICDVSIQLSEQELTQKRTYPKLLEVLGDVGGLMEILFSFLKIISSFLTETLYEQSLVNNLFEFDLDKKIILFKKQKQKEKKDKKNNDFFHNEKINIYTPSSLKNIKKLYPKNSLFINDDITIQSKGKLNEEPILKNKFTNESILISKPKKRKQGVNLAPYIDAIKEYYIAYKDISNALTNYVIQVNRQMKVF